MSGLHSARIPSMMETYESFPFQADELTLPAKRPPATQVRKLIKGMERNARFIPSGRKGAGTIGHKWLLMTPTKWYEEQTILMDAAFATAREDWEARRDAWIAGDPTAARDEAGFIADAAANAEVLRTDARFSNPPFPVIKHPGHITIVAGTSADVVSRDTALHQQALDSFFLETNVQQALKRLFVKIVPKPLYNDKIGGDENDIDLFTVHDLLKHIKDKYDKMTPKEREALWDTFNSAMGDLSPEEYFARQTTCQVKLKKGPTPITDDQIKDKAIVHFNKVPYMQRYVEEWEDKEDPTNTKTIKEFQTYFIQHATRHHDNQAALREAGIVNQVDAAAKSDLAQARAEVSYLRNQMESLSSNVSELAGYLSQAENETPSKSTAPTQTNQVGQMTPDIQALLNRMAKLEQKQDVLRDSSNTSTKATKQTESATKGKPVDNTGRMYTIYCANCGVQLTPGKCKDGCVRIKRNHRGLSFPTQAECDKVTFENHKQFPNASTFHEDKWGKEWSTVTDPRIVQKARS